MIWYICDSNSCTYRKRQFNRICFYSELNVFELVNVDEDASYVSTNVVQTCIFIIIYISWLMKSYCLK